MISSRHTTRPLLVDREAVNRSLAHPSIIICLRMGRYASSKSSKNEGIAQTLIIALLVVAAVALLTPSASQMFSSSFNNDKEEKKEQLVAKLKTLSEKLKELEKMQDIATVLSRPALKIVLMEATI